MTYTSFLKQEYFYFQMSELAFQIIETCISFNWNNSNQLYQMSEMSCLIQWVKSVFWNVWNKFSNEWCPSFWSEICLFKWLKMSETLEKTLWNPYSSLWKMSETLWKARKNVFISNISLSLWVPYSSSWKMSETLGKARKNVVVPNISVSLWVPYSSLWKWVKH